MQRNRVVPGGWGWRLLMRTDAWANRIYGSRYNPLYQSGAIVVALLGVLLVTGIYLLLFYRIGAPWESVARITEQVWLGRWIRGLHRFSSDAAIVAAVVHAFRMYAQRRSWGPRALAWISGVILLAVILVCGWTGYVLVWDTQAQLLAVEGARLLDILPLFSEPLGRTFVGERPLPSAFFFLNLFAHIALPIGVGLLVWIHISRVARPVLLPPRDLLLGVVGALTLLAVIWPIGMAPQADLFRIPTGAPLDHFFVFWLPLTRGLPVWLVWLLVGTSAAVVALVPVWTRPPRGARPTKSLVNERHCTGCEQCMHDCPYDAISMVPRADGREGLVAWVDQDLCVSCGICIGSCAPMAVGPVGRTGRDQLTAVRDFLHRMPEPRDLVVVGCEWSAAGRGWALRGRGGALDFAGSMRASAARRMTGGMVRNGGPPAPGVPAVEVGFSLFPVACAGNLHTSVIEFLMRSGVGGVLVVTCPARDCRGREGGRWLDQRVHYGREAELKERVDRQRLRIIEAGAGESALLNAALAEFGAEIIGLDLTRGENGPELNTLFATGEGSGNVEDELIARTESGQDAEIEEPRVSAREWEASS